MKVCRFLNNNKRYQLWLCFYHFHSRTHTQNTSTSIKHFQFTPYITAHAKSIIYCKEKATFRWFREASTVLLHIPSRQHLSSLTPFRHKEKRIFTFEKVLRRKLTYCFSVFHPQPHTSTSDKKSFR